MISDAESRSNNFGTPGVITRIDPADFPLTVQDQYELRENRGFSNETIAVARLGSVHNQGDLDRLGIDAQFEQLRSTIIIPFPPTDADGRYSFCLHKLNIAGAALSLYLAPPCGSRELILTEAPFKALAAFQLGYNAVALRGIESHINRIDEIVAAARSMNCDEIVVFLDTVEEIDGI